MKKLYLVVSVCAVIFSVYSENAHAANTWVSASGLTSASSELVMYRNTLGFATLGYLEKSTDTGKTWTQVTGGGSRMWNVFNHAIASSVDGSKVWATTCNSQCNDYVYYSTDGGTTWASSTVLGTSMGWWKVASSANGQNLILQSNNTTLVSTSSGATWTTVFGSIGHGTVAISPDGMTMVSINDENVDGSIHISTDAGATWSTASGISGVGTSAAVGNGGVMYIGTSGYIYRSSNYGATWTSLRLAGMNYWADLAISDDGKHILALGNVALFYSDDSGVSWYQGAGGGQWRLWYAGDGSKAYYSSGSAYVPIPFITTQSVSNVTATGATLNASIANDFAFQYSTSVKGFSYGTTNVYGTDASTAGTFTAGAYSQNLTSLTCNTTYFYRAYATNANGTGVASSTYFTTLPCTGSFVVNKKTIPTSGSTVVQLTGNGTGWTSGTPGSPTFTVSGVSGASIASQTVTDATHASITINTSATTGTLTITDPNNATSKTVDVVLATDVIPANDSHIIYSPGNTYDSGSGVQMMHTGSSAKFVFTGTVLRLDADLSTLISSGAAFTSYPFINWKIDGGAWQRAQLQPDSGVSTQVIILATGLSDTSHSAQVYYEQGGVEDSWPATSLLKITGWEIASGKSISTPTYADGLRPKRMMILGDSITRGYSAETDSSGVDHTTTGQTYVQDSWGMLFGQKLDAEVGIKAYSGQGYRKIGAAPAVTGTFDYVDSQHYQALPGDLDYLVIAQGANDYQNDVFGSVKELLTLARAQVGSNTKIFLMPSFLTLNDLNTNPEITTQIQTGLAAYQVAYPSDTKVYFFNIGDIFGAVDPYHPTTYMLEAIHPNHAGHALLATSVANIAEGYAPTIISSIATSSGATSVTITWNTDRSADTLVNYGSTASYTASSTYTSAKTLTHSVTITGLSSSQTYHYQIVSVDTASSTITTGDATFRTTGVAIAPSVSASSPTSLSATSVTLNASITADGGDPSFDVGFRYGLTSSYGSTASSSGTFSAGAFSKALTGLAPSTTYHYQAFATNSAGTATTSDQTFTTTAVQVTTPPTLTTSISSVVSTSSMTLNANISSTGGADAVEHGFAYSIVSSLSSGVATTSLGAFSGTGNFSQGITGLIPSTTYYFRSYAVNSAGTSTGAILSTTTHALVSSDPGTAPTVSVQSASSVTTSGAVLNGTLVDIGSTTPTIEGFEWGTSQSYGNQASANGSFSSGVFTQNITGLTCGVTYHYRSFATNTNGTGTSGDQTFTTSACSSGGGGGGSGGGSSGGGSSTWYVAPPAWLTATTSTSTVPKMAPYTTPYTAVGYVFSRALSIGLIGQDVKNLQIILNKKGYIVAGSGPGSIGNESTYFGPATQAALRRFQCATLSVCSGTPLTTGYGATGPRTRALLNGNSISVTVPAKTSVVAPKTTVTPKTTTTSVKKATVITPPKTTTVKPIVVPTIDFGF